MPDMQFQQYASSMKYLGRGHAFLEMPCNRDAKPGILGYIDDNGRWQRLLDLRDEKEMKRLGYTTLPSISLRPKARTTWGALKTETVNREDYQLGGEATVPAAGGVPVPITAKAHFRLSGTAQLGAVLFCADPVVTEEFAVKEPFKEWVKQNGVKLLQEYGDIEKRGFYVMTTTYSAADVWLQIWTETERMVSIGTKAGVQDLVALNASSDHAHAQSMDGWLRPQVKVCGHDLISLTTADSYRVETELSCSSADSSLSSNVFDGS
jgi:hypothetical protein